MDAARENIKHRDVLSVWLVSLEKEKSNIGQMVKTGKYQLKRESAKSKFSDRKRRRKIFVCETE